MGIRSQKLIMSYSFSEHHLVLEYGFSLLFFPSNPQFKDLNTIMNVIHFIFYVHELWTDHCVNARV